jgi:hypothetical protein
LPKIASRRTPCHEDQRAHQDRTKVLHGLTQNVRMLKLSGDNGSTPAIGNAGTLAQPGR